MPEHDHPPICRSVECELLDKMFTLAKEAMNPKVDFVDDMEVMREQANDLTRQKLYHLYVELEALTKPY